MINAFHSSLFVVLSVLSVLSSSSCSSCEFPSSNTLYSFDTVWFTSVSVVLEGDVDSVFLSVVSVVVLETDAVAVYVAACGCRVRRARCDSLPR